MKLREKRFMFESIAGIFAVFGFGIATGFALGFPIGIWTTTYIVADTASTMCMLEDLGYRIEKI